LNDQIGPDRPEIVKCCEELLDPQRQPPCHSSHLRIFLIDSIAEKLQKNDGDGVIEDKLKEEYLKKANQVELINLIRIYF